MDHSQLTQLLHDHALKATAPRLKLLAAMHSYESAMPYSSIQEAMHPIDRVTLYRTLDSLMSKGVIHKAFQSDSDLFYAICDHHCSVEEHQHNHLHFKCTQCESVTCETPDKALHIALSGYQIQQVSISLEGICKQCSV